KCGEEGVHVEHEESVPFPSGSVSKPTLERGHLPLKSRTDNSHQTFKDLEESITGKPVLIIEDIVDTGLTLSYLRRSLLARNPASLEIFALLSKPSRRRVDLDVKYVGFEVPDVFVVGYGIDYAGAYRNLPDIHGLNFEAFQEPHEG
ncbi:MAG: phosphoribosyltransferase, partial [Rubrobacteraceae bacterium]